MVRPRDPRHLLIKEVWPDKLLYGTLLVVVSSAMGIFHGLLSMAFPLPVSHGDLLQWMSSYPVWLTVLLSLLAFVTALIAWRKLSVWWGLFACLLGVLSFSLYGIGSLHAAAAVLFLILARIEGEDRTPKKDRVDKFEWPDKAFATSLLLFLAGIVSIVWGIGVTFGEVSFGRADSIYWGPAQMIAGVVGLVAADFVYRQRAPLLALVACVFNVAAFAGYFLAPGFAVAALVALVLAWRENEFLDPMAPPSSHAEPPGE